VEKQLVVILKLFFFFKVNPKEREVKEYLLRADYVSRNNLSLEDWLRSLGVGAVPQYGGGRNSHT
jgi:hypothetical protein